MVAREIEAPRDEVGDDVGGVVGDAPAAVVIDDGDDVAMDGAAVDRAAFVPRLEIIAKLEDWSQCAGFRSLRPAPLEHGLQIHEGNALCDPIEQKGAERFIAGIGR
jgi:hypothetical protein